MTSLEDEPLQRDLATLVAAELLYQRGQPPRAVYTFKHALIQEAAYESVLQRVRRQTHQRIVQVLEAQFPETVATQPELLAHHALRGELWDQAVTYFRQAGEQAVARSAYREAVAAFEQALGALQHLPESRDTLAQAIDLRLALRNALWPLGELGRLLVYLQDAQALAEALGDQQRLGWVSAYLLAHFVEACEPDHAFASGQRALAIATDLGEVSLTVTAQHYLGNGYRSLGDYRRAIEFLPQELWRVSTARCSMSASVCMVCASVISRSTSSSALPSAAPSPRGGRPPRKGYRLLRLLITPTAASWRIGRWAFGRCARETSPRPSPCSNGLSTSRRRRTSGSRALGAAALGAAYTLAGRIAEALPLLEQAVEQALAMHFMFDHALRVVWLGEAYLLRRPAGRGVYPGAAGAGVLPGPSGAGP